MEMHDEMERVTAEKCIKCGLCLKVCLLGCHHRGETEISYDPTLCIGCYQCMAICPEDAIVDQLGAALEEIAQSLPDPDKVDRLLKGRRSIRVYKPNPIKEEDLNAIIDAARWAPSGHNGQVRELVVLESREKILNLSEAAINNGLKMLKTIRNPLMMSFISLFSPDEAAVMRRSDLQMTLKYFIERSAKVADPVFYGAPLVLLLHASPKEITPKDDCCYAMLYMIMAAEARGIGSCLNGFALFAFQHNKSLRKSFGIPEDHMVYAAAGFGYPAVKYRKYPYRRPLQVKYL